MGRCRGLVLALMLGSITGCLGDRATSSSSLLSRFRGSPSPAGPEPIQLDFALVQVPLADDARYRDLWTFLDEQAVPLEKKTVLEENGYRVGRVGANPPEELLELMTNRRYCPNPRRIQIELCKEEKLLELGPAIEHASFNVVQSEQSRQVALESAQCCIGVLLSLTEDGRTRLSLGPRIRHAGRDHMPWRPSADLSGWSRQFQKPVESFPGLDWEVQLMPGEYLVIGAREDRPDTIAHLSFLRFDEQLPVKRLLVLRAWRPADPRLAPGGGGPTEETRREAVPLALQAGMSSARGVAP
jgi:hypothetical protein